MSDLISSDPQQPESVSTRWTQAAQQWSPSKAADRIFTLDAHTEGEPLRVILGGFPEPKGDSILARRRWSREHADHLRRALMLEPRGHADMYGCIIVPPERPTSAFGVLFTHNAGYSTMCGHGILAITRVAVELGMIELAEGDNTFGIDAPAGLISATAYVEGGVCTRTSFVNVPSWADTLDAEISVPGLGHLRYDVGFGGAYYAFVDADELGLELTPANSAQLIEVGRRIKSESQKTTPPRHPQDDDLSFIYGTIFTGRAHEEGRHSRHVCVFADGEVDRSPTGTGVSARLALLHSRGKVELDQEIIIESIIGSRFHCSITELAHGQGPDGILAVVPRVEGRSSIIGRSEWFVDPESDPLAHGFFLR